MDTIEDIRRANLRALASELGGQRALADAVGIAPAQISQWITGAPNNETGTPRAPSSDSCRKIEAKLRKPRGWMDSSGKSERVAVAAMPPADTPQAILNRLAALLSSTPKGNREAVAALLAALATSPEKTALQTALVPLLDAPDEPRRG